MAKAIKSKTVIEETKNEVPETTPQVTGETLPVVEETIAPEIIEEKQVEPEVIPEPIKKEVVIKPSVAEPKKSMEQRIIDYINSRDGGEIKLNDFLKSLFEVPKLNEPTQWLSQAASKQLRVLLDKMKKEGSISLANDNYLHLGTFYYPDAQTGRTHYHTLNTVQIVAKK